METSFIFVLNLEEDDSAEICEGDATEERLNCFELMSLLHLQDNRELWDRICEAVKPVQIS